MPEKMANPINCSRFNFALVSRIANSFKDSSSFDLRSNDSIDIERARKEHSTLVETLQKIGVDVIELPCDEKHPDGLFVDDIAVVINNTALICNPPTIKDKPSRQGELAMVRQVLRKELGLKIVEVEESEKATVEGGDVLWTGREIYVGISTRTNTLGAQAVAKAFPEYPTTIVHVVPPAVHLKDCLTMAGPDVMVVSKTPHAQTMFQDIIKSGSKGYRYIPVQEDEAANVLYCNGMLVHLSNDLIPQGFAEIRNLGSQGYRYMAVEEDEAANVLFCNGMLVHLSSDQIPKGFAVFENKIDYPRVAIHMSEPLKRGGRLGSCVLLINRVRHPKKIPSTANYGPN